MSDLEYESAEVKRIERLCKEHFGVELHISAVVASDVEMPQSDSYATVFNADNAVYALCETSQPVNLRDIQSQIKRMGLEAEFYYPPANDMNYFSRFGEKIFLSVFPGRTKASDNDTIFYQTLTPYNPALVRIRKVKGGIRRFNMRGNTWQTIKDFSYSRIQVQ